MHQYSNKLCINNVGKMSEIVEVSFPNLRAFCWKFDWGKKLLFLDFISFEVRLSKRQIKIELGNIKYLLKLYECKKRGKCENNITKLVKFDIPLPVSPISHIFVLMIIKVFGGRPLARSTEHMGYHVMGRESIWAIMFPYGTRGVTFKSSCL